MTLGELARAVIIAGGDLFYGGHLEPDGITAFLIDELHRYGRRDRPLKVCLAWTVHSRMSAKQLAEQQDIIGLFGEIHLLSPEGRRIDGHVSEAAQDDFTPEQRAQALTGLRNYMISNTDARIVTGGKRADFEGAMPGVVEEALLSVERRQPLFFAGGFGGATIDIIRTLRADYAEWFPRLPNEPEIDARLADGLSRIAEVAAVQDWDGYKNGLSEDENYLLAASYRPSEIAALVGKGLGRLLVE